MFHHYKSRLLSVFSTLSTLYRLSGVAFLAIFVIGCQTPVQNRLAESQANEIIVALHKHGVGATKKASQGATADGRFDVFVTSGDLGKALNILSAADLPRESDPGLNDIFGQGGLVPTVTEERARYHSAIAGELAESIERIDGVLDARVHLAIPDRRTFVLDETPPSPRGSVLIKYRPGNAPYDVEAIRALVAGAVEDMQKESIAVIGVPSAAVVESGSSLSSLGPLSIAPGSMLPLRIILGTLLLCIVGLAGLLAWAMRRRGKVATA